MKKVICTVYPDNEVQYEIIGIEEKSIEFEGKKLVFEKVKLKEIENPNIILTVDKSFICILEEEE